MTVLSLANLINIRFVICSSHDNKFSPLHLRCMHNQNHCTEQEISIHLDSSAQSARSIEIVVASESAITTAQPKGEIEWSSSRSCDSLCCKPTHKCIYTFIYIFHTETRIERGRASAQQWRDYWRTMGEPCCVASVPQCRGAVPVA